MFLKAVKNGTYSHVVDIASEETGNGGCIEILKYLIFIL